jgi:hypothetical protein
MDLESEDSWSDSEPDACDQASLPLHSRAYQIEMFEQSMQGNIIAIVRTGSCPSIDSTDIYVDGYWEWKDSSVSILSRALVVPIFAALASVVNTLILVNVVAYSWCRAKLRIEAELQRSMGQVRPTWLYVISPGY